MAPDREIGLSVDELIEIYNESVTTFQPGTQEEIKRRSAEWTKLATFPEDMPADFAIIVQFVINAIRANNRKLLRDLERA